MKTCIKCSFFGAHCFFRRATNICLVCHKKYTKQHREKNKAVKREYDKQYRITNKEKIQAHQKQHYEKNQEELKLYQQQYREENPEYMKSWRISNIEEIKEYYNRYSKERKENDINFRLRHNVSASINTLLKRNGSSKNGRSITQYLLYTIQELKLNIETQFELWMNWKNYGKYNAEIWKDNDSSTWTWQLDHIIPHSTFKYTSMDCQEFRDCWALSNLRPLSAKQNWADGVTRKRHL